VSLASNINIAVVGLLAISGLFGALVGLRFKIFFLVPSALMIAFFSAVVLHMNDFGTWSGTAIVVACLILNQATYLIVQIYGPTVTLRSNEVANGVPNR
jgi:hypothetical protein